MDSMRITAAAAAALSALLLWGGARAEPAEPEPSPHEAPPEARERFERLRANEQIPKRWRGEWKLDPDSPSFWVQGRLHDYDDGVVLLAIAVDAPRREILLRQGAREVFDRRLVRDHTVFGGEYFKALHVVHAGSEACEPACAEEEAGLQGPDSLLLERRVGERVRLQLKRTLMGRLRIMSVLEVREKLRVRPAPPRGPERGEPAGR